MIERDDCLLLIIDVQGRLAPAVLEHERVTHRIGALLDGAKLYGIPAWGTEHCAERIGPLVPAIGQKLVAENIIAKAHFAVTREAGFIERLRATARSTLVLAGMEAHVCVMQTALGLREAGFEVVLVADCAGSRPERQEDRALAMARMANAGCLITTAETLLFEWAQDAADARFREVLRLVKSL